MIEKTDFPADFLISIIDKDYVLVELMKHSSQISTLLSSRTLVNSSKLVIGDIILVKGYYQWNISRYFFAY